MNFFGAISWTQSSAHLNAGCEAMAAFFRRSGQNVCQTEVGGSCIFGAGTPMSLETASRLKANMVSHRHVTIFGRIASLRGRLVEQLAASSQEDAARRASATLEACDEHCAIIVDHAARRLTLVKDGLGTRALYYVNDRSQRTVYFSSTQAALLALPGVSRSLNLRALGAYLVVQSPLSSETYYDDVRSVPNASTVSFDAEGNEIPRRYWYPAVHPDWWETNRQQPHEAFRTELTRAVTSRIPDHERVGIALSGGLDSGAVAAIASVCFPSVTFETYTEILPEHYLGQAVDEKSIVTRMTKDFANLRPNFFDGLDIDYLAEGEASFDLLGCPVSNIQGSLFCKMNAHAKDAGVEVLLGGFGGDQCVSAGAEGYLCELTRAGRLRAALREAQRLHSYRETPWRNIFRKHLISPLLPAWFHTMRMSLQGRPWHTSLAIRPGFAREVGLLDYLAPVGWTYPQRLKPGVNDQVRATLEFIISSVGLTAESTYADWMGVEYRSPFYDRRVIETFMSIPSEFKVGPRQERYMFRSALRRDVPSYVLDRDDKGPGSPHLRTRLRDDIARLRHAFARFQSNSLWASMIDFEKVENGLADIESTAKWATSRSDLNMVILPYYLGDFLERHEASGR